MPQESDRIQYLTCQSSLSEKLELLPKNGRKFAKKGQIAQGQKMSELLLNGLLWQFYLCCFSMCLLQPASSSKYEVIEALYSIIRVLATVVIPTALFLLLILVLVLLGVIITLPIYKIKSMEAE